MCKHSGEGKWIHNRRIKKIRWILNLFKKGLSWLWKNMHIWKGNGTQKGEKDRWWIMRDWQLTGKYGKKAAAAATKSLQSCPTLCDPIDGSPPGSPVPGILQAKTLEWVAISFSNAWSEKWKWSRSVMSDSSRAHGLQPTRLLRPWDFPGKSTGVGCHCLLWRSYKMNQDEKKLETQGKIKIHRGWIFKKIRKIIVAETFWSGKSNS